MMIDLLKTGLLEQQVNTENISVCYKDMSGLFVLSDLKSCDEGLNNVLKQNVCSQCNKETLRIESNVPVIVIDFEKYISQYKGIGKRCDYILYSDSDSYRKTAFCDLTCSEEKYLQMNKRARAQEQIKESIELLTKSNVIFQNISTTTELVGLLGWREPLAQDENTHSRDSVEDNMLVFSRNPSSMAKQIISQQEILGRKYKFIQIKYPFVYNWQSKD